MAGTTAPGAPGSGSLVARVLGAVRAHRPVGAREEASARRVVEGLVALARPFDEDGGPVHVTGSAIVVGRRGVVLHLHKRLRRWLQPGGHVEPGEAPWETARRETEEETGLPVAHPAGGPRLIHVDVHEAAGGHTHLDLRYLLVAPDADPAPGPGESPHVRWFAWDEAAALADEALGGALVAAARQPEAGPGRAPRSAPRPRPAQWGGEPLASPTGRRPAGGSRVSPQDVATGGDSPAAEGPFDRLLAVQAHDTVVDQLTHRRATLPERARLTEVGRKLSALDVRVKEVRGEREELGTRQAGIEQQIEASRARKAALEKRLYGGQVAAARELQAMSDEVKHLGRHIGELEDRELEIMETLEPVDGELQEADVARDGLEGEATSLRAAIVEAERAIDAETAGVAAERAEVASGVPSDLLARYERLRAKLGGTGAARLVGGSCGGCHLALPSMEVDRIRKAPPDAVITCEQCGRILVR